MASKKVIHLEITTWAGMSIGAIHYYGKLVGEDEQGEYKKVEVEKGMTAREARAMNKLDGTRGLYKAGSTTSRFDRREQVIERALEIWKDHFPEGEILLIGSSSTVDPQEVLVGPEELKTVVNAWVKQYEDEYEGYPDEIYQRWRKLMRPWMRLTA